MLPAKKRAETALFASADRRLLDADHTKKAAMPPCGSGCQLISESPKNDEIP